MAYRQKWDLPARFYRQQGNPVRRLNLPLSFSEPASATLPAAWVPAVDIREAEGAFRVEVELPGLTKDDIDITVEHNLLRLSGERRFEAEGSEETYRRVERSYGSFLRTFSLPEEITPESVKASFKDGVLTISLPKIEGGALEDLPETGIQPGIAERGPIPAVALTELHDPDSGRIDARRVAAYLNISLKDLAAALEKNYTTVQKTPTAASLQEALRPIKRSLQILEEVLGDRISVLAWWNSPHPDLGLRCPLDLLLAGHGQSVADMLEAAVLGTPS